MSQYIVRRLLLLIPTVILASTVAFLFLRLMPGDPARQILMGSGGGGGTFQEEDLRNLQRKLGTDRHVIVQYGTWMRDMFTGDPGTSFWYRKPVTDLLKHRVPVTLQLAVMALIIAFAMAVPLGVISALKRNTPIDYIARSLSFTGISIPDFITGLVVVYLLVRVFGWLPPLDYTEPWDDLGKNLTQLIFPALALAFFVMAFISRVTRSSVLEVLREDYIRTARAKGLRERTVLFIHALRNALLPIVSLGGWVLGIFLGGSVVMEHIFVLPGMGTLMINAIHHRDYPIIQAVVLLVTGIVLFVNLTLDFLYGWLDPRVRFQ